MFTKHLKTYFCSGWAFLIPYLLAYLLYAGMKWPVHPGDGGQWVPSLLHVYWFLHAVHLLLGALALHAWWPKCSVSANQPENQTAAGGPWALASQAVPWLLFALFLVISGPYLEYPADPWEHLARINQWSQVSQVQDHPAWSKSSYFLAYSLVGRGITPTAWALNIYYTAACLLLCWQYYRLGRSAGLGARSAMIFVILQAVLFGNSLFSFFRYYGISSTLFAQLGAIAMIRFGLGLASNTSVSARACVHVIGGRALQAGSLLLLISYNHVQGVGIAFLGVLACILHQLVDRRSSTLLWLGAVTVILSLLAVGFWPRHPHLDPYLNNREWMTAWQGLNLFSYNSVAGARTIQILGATGLFNLTAAIWLCRRNHVVAWLTLVPLLALSVPVVAIPLANQLLVSGEGNITAVATFHRFFLGIPSGLALCVLLRTWIRNPRASSRSPFISSCGFNYAFLLLAVSAMLLFPPGAPYYNRTWNSLASPPADLQYRLLPKLDALLDTGKPWLASQGLTFALRAVGGWAPRQRAPERFRIGLFRPSAQASEIMNALPVEPASRGLESALLPSVEQLLVSPGSQAGYLSQHWSSHHLALDLTGHDEIRAAALNAGYLPESDRLFLLHPDPTAP